MQYLSIDFVIKIILKSPQWLTGLDRMDVTRSEMKTETKICSCPLFTGADNRKVSD